MTKRLATTILAAMILVAGGTSLVRAQDNENARITLKGITAVGVQIAPLPDAARIPGLTREIIQADVELKVRAAGIRIVTMEESHKLLGDPNLLVSVSGLEDAQLAHIKVELHQNAVLQRNKQLLPGVVTWSEGITGEKQSSQDIRDMVEDMIDVFLNAWLSVNPKK